MLNKNSGRTIYWSQFGGETSIPWEFMAAMDRSETIQPVANDVEPEPLSGNIVMSKVETNRNNERVKHVVTKKDGNITLQDYRTNDQGQIIRVTKTLRPTAAAPTGSTSSTANVGVHDLGNGWSIEEVMTEGVFVGGVFIAGLFGAEKRRAQRPDMTPPKFQFANEERESELIVEGNVGTPNLGSDEFDKSEEQLTQFTKRIRTKSRAHVTIPVSIMSRETNERKQFLNVQEKLMDEDAGPTEFPDEYQTVRYERLGDGRAVQTTKTADAVFDEVLYGKEYPEVIPLKFRAALPLTDEQHIEVGTAAAPTLSAGEIERSEQQVDSFTKRTRLRSRSLVTLPKTLESLKRGDRGQEVFVQDVLSAGWPPSLGIAFGTLKAEAEDLGTGQNLRTIEYVESFPLLTGQEYDEAYRLPISFTDEILEVGTEPFGDPNVEVRPIDQFHSRVITKIDPTAALEDYFLAYHGNAKIDLPDVLTAVTIYWELGTGAGSGSETGSAAMAGSSGSVSLNIPNSAEASKTAIPELIPFIQTYPAENLPVVDYFFFVPNNSSRATILSKLSAATGLTINEWPKFKPKPVHFVLQGQKVSVRAQANARVSYSISPTGSSSAESSGTQQSADVSSTIRTITTRPAIHGAISFSGAVSQSLTVSASASAFIGGIGDSVSPSESLYGQVNPVSLSATPGANAIPSSGYYAYKFDSQLFKYDYTGVRIRVFNFADL